MKVTYDNKSFIINGERVFLNSGSIHYFRFPREEWREVLVKAKLAGLNCVDTYFAWNFHEVNEGVWDFEGDKDCDYFLQLCGELGLYVIARPGPYICAEWDFGGLPWWLSTKEGIEYRVYNEAFLKYTDLYFDKIIPIIAKHQISNGGPVILVQVENEYAGFLENIIGKPYHDYLKEGTERRGINVPLISCVGDIDGTIECANFWSWGDSKITALKEKQPDYPKIVTEFWTGWFENWGGNKADQKTAGLLEKKMMEVVRAGFSGLNHYMFYGGTNFGSWGGRTVGSSDIFMVTSYDYDAPVNEYNCITEKYNIVKNLSSFFNTISKFLTESTDIETKAISNDKCKLMERVLEDQRLIFVESVADERVDQFITLENGETYKITLNPFQIAPLIVNYALTENIRMSYNSFVSGFEKLDGIDTLVVFADNRQRSTLKLRFKEEIVYNDQLPVLFSISNDKKTITFDFCHFNDVQTFNLSYGTESFRVIVLDRETANKAWWTNLNNADSNPFSKQLIIGCESLDIRAGGNIKVGSYDLHPTLKIFGGSPLLKNNPLWAFNSLQGCFERTYDLLPAGNTRISSLTDWNIAEENLLKSARKVENPIDFSGYGKDFGYLVYSAEIESCCDRLTTIVIPSLQDTARVYLNGVEIALIREVISSSIEIKLSKGLNSLAFLVQNMGRYNYSTFMAEPKGISGPVYIDGKTIDLRNGWAMENGSIINMENLNQTEGFPRLTQTFESDGYDRAVLVGTVANNIWVNGTRIERGNYNSWWKFISIDISKYLVKGQNTIQMEDFFSNISTLKLHLYKSSDKINAWRMNTISDTNAEKEWSNVTPDKKGKPTWFKCTFIKPETPENMALKLKLRMSGMGKGFIWLNGKEIGRYWQIGPQEDYKLPISWLADTNELVIFDEEGRNPGGIKLMWEESSMYVEAPLL